MNASNRHFVDQKIIENTKCDKNFQCLDGEEVYCSVSNTLGASLVRLECKDLLECRYNKAYGAIHACSCPVRIEIFKKKGI